MLSYSNIIKQSYYITLRFKVLWVFGLFVVGGFNVGFFRFSGTEVDTEKAGFKFIELLNFFVERPAALAILSFSLLLVAVFGLLLVNWSRIMLVLGVADILKTKNLNLEEGFKKSQKSLRPVIKISLFTTGFIFFIFLALFAPTMFWVKDPQYQNWLTTLGVGIFLPLLFTASCINIFTSFFIILFGNSLKSALELAIDFVATKWAQIIGLMFVLMVIYAAVFISGVAIIYAFRFLLQFSFEALGFFRDSAMIILPRTLAGLLLWCVLGGLNVFFNTSLVLLFLELVKPIEAEKEKAKEISVSPVTTI